MLKALRKRVDETRSKIADLSLLAERHPRQFPGGAENLRRAVAERGAEFGLRLVIRSMAGFAGLVGDRAARRLQREVLEHLQAADGPVDAAELAEALTDGSARLAGRIMALLRVKGELVRVGEEVFDRPDRSFPEETEADAADEVERILRAEARPVQVDHLREALAGRLGKRSSRWYLSLAARVEEERGWHRSGTLISLTPVPEGGEDGVVRAACRRGRSWSDVLSEVRFRIRIPESRVSAVRRLFCDLRVKKR